MDYFKKLSDLLKMERKEDRQSYTAFTQRSSVNERRTNGITWYPVAIRGSEPARGDYLTVEFERTTNLDVVHQFRFGMPAALFSNHDAQQDRIEGTISYQGGNTLKITLNTDELPEWSRNGKLGVDLLFDEGSYDEMESALKTASQLMEKEKEDRLIKVLTGENPAVFGEEMAITQGSLNASQAEAVKKILSAKDLAIVHGPPGTGKTTTLVQAIKTLWSRDRQQILVVAPSNTAVDLLSEKLSAEGLNVLRVGNPVRVSERLMSLTLDSKMATHPRMKDVKKMKKQAADFKNMAHIYKRNFGKSERDQRKALFDEAHKIMKEVGNTEQFISDDLIARAQVIAATLIGANHFTIKKLRYHTVVMDEAGQALEPAAWIPALKAQKLILAGDPFQLPPTIKSMEAARDGLSTTLLEKSIALHPESVVLLEEQYRMNEQIMGFSSAVFYENRLRAHPSVASHLLNTGEKPLEFIDTAGCGFEEKSEGTSISNPEEAAFLIKHLHRLVVTLKEHYSLDNFPTIGVISPYRQQVLLMKEYFSHVKNLATLSDKISINTIDSFQGQEKDIICISMCRSNTAGQIGFLSDARRMNVAMTRARKKLIVVGDSATLSRFSFYADFIAYAEEKNAYHSAWEFINE